MSMNWIDAHCHLSDQGFDEGRETLYRDLIAHDIKGLVLAGTDPLDWERQTQLTPPLPLRIAKVFGIHPWNVDSMSDQELDEAVHTLAKYSPHCQGLGEMGLDYYRAKSPEQREKHKLWFDRQLELAKGKDLPLVLHVVRAHHDSLPQLRRHQKHYSGLVHSFWAHLDVAKAYIDMGFILSVPPRIMKEDPHQILSNIAPEHIVFETDTPFQNAEGIGMKPFLIHDILEFVSRSRGEDIEVTVNRQAQILVDMFPVLKG